MMDLLMGKQRDVAEDEKKAEMQFWDPKMDKMWLAGLSPHNLFVNTKSNLGHSDLEQDDKCKAVYDALPQEEKDKYGYEYDLMVFLQDMVKQCDLVIAKNKARIDRTIDLTPEEVEKVAAIKEKIQLLGKEMEELGENGQVDAAHALVIKIDELMKEKQTVELGLSRPGLVQTTEKKVMFVCEVSGNFMCSTDNDVRLKNHYDGKQYKGWKLVRYYSLPFSLR